MKVSEVLKIWLPIENMPVPLYIHNLCTQGRQLTLEFLSKEIAPQYVIRFVFKGYAAYRSAHEINRMQLWKNVGDTAAELGCTLYTVENSDFMAWLHVQSADIHKDSGIVHYLFFMDDEVIDVLTAEPPSVTWYEYTELSAIS